MNTRSVWQHQKMPHFPKLPQRAAFDVVIIGGGITGLTTAYLLKKQGQKVCLLEREQLGAADTGHTTAHLTCVTDLRLPKMVSAFGKKAAGMVWEAGRAAIDVIEQIAAEEQIACEFKRVPGFLHASLTGSRDETQELRQEAGLTSELGFEASFVDAVPFLDRPGVRYADQAKFHPLAYLAGLASKIDGDGSAIFEHTEATDVQGDPLQVTANGYEISCNYLVICTHVPLMGKTGLVSATVLQTKLFPYSTYALGAKLPKGLLPEASYWDTSDPYYYLRIDRHPDHDYAIFGGHDHKTGQQPDTDKCYAELESVFRRFFPDAKVDHHWSGQVIETNDGLPYIGETVERQFVATGFSGNGMTFGTFAAMMACDAATGRTNSWQELFDVHRKKVWGGTSDFLRENIDFPYYYLKDRLLTPTTPTTRTIKRGEGKVVKLDGQHLACFRDARGKLSKVSAVCTHMGCLVRWNVAEKTWDCPCHGSRFHANGEVMAGPAESPLEPVKSRAKSK